MFKRTFEKSTTVPGPQRDVFDWHTRPGAFERLTPPWDDTRVIEYEGIRDGERVVLEVKAPWRRRWIAEHEQYIDGLQFMDRQVKGPFPKWVHTHRVEPSPDGRPNVCLMRDHIDFKLPAGPLGVIAYALFMKKKIRAMFDHRHMTLVADTLDHQRIANGRHLTVAITGASGTIGQALSAFLTTGGHTVRRVERHDGLTFDLDAIADVDVLVHLAGEPIAQKWDADVRDRIKRSRVDRTKLLCQQLSRMPAERRPRVMLCGSATGIYGDRGDSILTEDSAAGQGFLADVASAWESQTRLASAAGIRVVYLRTGIVLTPRGGALEKMVTPFKLGLGGRLGKGKQYMSWITIDDHIRAMYHAMFDDKIVGPLNLVSPEPVTNRVFAKTLGRVLRRPTLFPAPRFMLKRAYGDMVDEALLVSHRVEPMRLKAAGFRFRQPNLEAALRELLGRI